MAEKENEISAVKDLLTPVYVKDRVWTADAMHTQKTACQRIDQLGGKYLFFFKDNHPTAHEDLALFFQDPEADQSSWGFFSQTDKGHGRLTTRTVRTSTQMNDWFAKQWTGIAQTFEVTRTVKRKRRKVASRHSPPVSLEPKRWEHVQEALVKETGWNDGVAGPEQRGVLSVGRDVCYTTDCQTQLYRMGNRHFLRRG